jgi:hypothetical protein
MNWGEYFSMMGDWKRLPAYKAEPRIDSLVGFYLPAMASAFLSDEILGIVPELPIRLGTVKPKHEDTNYADRSYKVDFYLLGTSGIHYFVEFKTDSRSRRSKQDEYLQESEGVGMAAIVDGIVRIASVSSYKKKYDHLLDKLTGLGVLDAAREFAGSTDTIKIVYAQPHVTTDDADKLVLDFEWMAQWLVDNHSGSEFESALSQSLLRWSTD